MSGALSAGILAVVLGLAVASGSRRDSIFALMIFSIVALCVSYIPLDASMKRHILATCWVSAMVVGIMTYLPKRLPLPIYVLIALWTGGAAGASVAVAGQPFDLAAALPWVMVIIPAQYCIRRGWTLVPKVLASWLVAVSILGVMLALTATPGYVPDHME